MKGLVCDHEWSAELREVGGTLLIVQECEKCGKEEQLDDRRMYD